MKVIPIASESLGVRSLSTFIKTKDIALVIDPGLALAPDRYKLEPAEIEFETLHKLREELNKYCEKANILVISHYHYDHYTPFFDDKYLESKNYASKIYRDKILLIKHPTEHINQSQMNRAKEFLENVKDLAKKIEFADNKEFVFGDTRIKISKPFPHGKDDKLGYVIITIVDDGNFKVMHTSDTQGILFDEIKDLIIRENPNLLIVGGPPTYMMYRYGKKSLELTNKNLDEIRKKIDGTIIIDHHLVRDKKFKEKINIDFITMAEYLGKKNMPLEAYRKELHKGMKIEELF
ncbi:conserved hypothetical protein [Methanocaldococcus infernus ME]|uniref:UPF0282 protein Metin_1440 n=1 Tax=Methanocaldococcus infernus (strain DSM 11812 / JCM 15783 / ME) TaxID=573063 RepID=D5VU35_METIM|nr:hypothetical protein [Methanocaldococcus infernus]ADG14088.1 conserved hypothetical protein [Methanocaldococcus infernus ME]